MKRMQAICCLFLLCSIRAIAQDPATASPPPGPPVRVPGQPNSPEELAAFNQLMVAGTPGERIVQGQAFLSNYPNSGLSSYVHHFIANSYGMDNPQNYVEHAELALRELPSSPSLLATLAFIYSETGKTELGAERGRAALRVIQGIEKPAQITESNWLLQKLEVGGQANYAIGRHLMAQAADPNAPDHRTRLEEAGQFLTRAMEQLPDDPYSTFRLGECYLKMNELEQAFTYFARTTAIGGSIADIARTRLEELYRVSPGKKGLDELLREQAQALEKARQSREAMLNVLAEPQKPGNPPGNPPSGAGSPVALLF